MDKLTPTENSAALDAAVTALPVVEAVEPVEPVEPVILEPRDSEGRVLVAPDRMRAFINMTMPENGGQTLSLEKITKMIAEAKVQNGLRELTIKHLATEPLFNREILIAEGTLPQKGKDGTLIYAVRLSKDTVPTERADGSVDYKNLGIIENVEKDQLLCTKVPPEPGTDGLNVLGQVMKALPGKQYPLPAGKGTYISEDLLELRALVAGDCTFSNNRLNVQETFTVNGDVSLSTGNISFIGNVVITGNVLAGFTVQAGGSIVVNGAVSGSTLIAGGDITIANGFHGMQKGKLVSGGSIRCKYIQAGQVQAAVLVEAQVILSAEVQCGDSIKLVGARSTILGGKVTAKSIVDCQTIGSPTNPVLTVIEVGSDPTLVARADEISKEQAITTKNIADVDRILVLLKQLESLNRLTDDKREMMLRSVHTRRMAAESLVALNHEADDVRIKLASEGYGTIMARTAIYPGVRIIIGPERYSVATSTGPVMMIRNADGITTRPTV